MALVETSMDVPVQWTSGLRGANEVLASYPSATDFLCGETDFFGEIDSVWVHLELAHG
jgi:hypothetical protein